MKRKLLVPIACFILFIPIVINAVGWNFYSYVFCDRREASFGATMGVCYLSWSEGHGPIVEVEPPEGFTEYTKFNVDYIALVSNSRIRVFLEKRYDPMRFLLFDAQNDLKPQLYRSVTFPWIILSVLPLLALVRKPKPNK
jgi:hypothetical protein